MLYYSIIQSIKLSIQFNHPIIQSTLMKQLSLVLLLCIIVSQQLLSCKGFFPWKGIRGWEEVDIPPDCAWNVYEQDDQRSATDQTRNGSERNCTVCRKDSLPSYKAVGINRSRVRGETHSLLIYTSSIVFHFFLKEIFEWITKAVLPLANYSLEIEGFHPIHQESGQLLRNLQVTASFHIFLIILKSIIFPICKTYHVYTMILCII